MSDIIPEFPLQIKQCPRCNTQFPATTQFFQSYKRAKDGLSQLCKPCNQEYRKLLRTTPRPPREIIPNGQKRCPKCKRILPATLEIFYGHRSRKDGLKVYCKECMNAPYRKPSIEVPEGMKRCSQCMQCKPATADFFVRSNKIKDGWEGRCKGCQHANWRAKHPLKWETPPEGCKRCGTCHKVYPATTGYFEPSKRKCDKGLRPQCRWCRAKDWEGYNKTHVGYRKLYYKEHKEQYKTHGENRRARKKAVPGTYTQQQIQEQLKRQHYRCYYAACGYAKFKKIQGKYVYHIEHTFPISRENARNDISHIVLSCPSCNLKKGDKFPWEWPEGGRLL